MQLKKKRSAEAMEAAYVGNANAFLKGILLLNGGAAIAILGMLGSFIYFAIGAGLAVLTAGMAYLTNSAYALVDGRMRSRTTTSTLWSTKRSRR